MSQDVDDDSNSEQSSNSDESDSTRSMHSIDYSLFRMFAFKQRKSMHEANKMTTTRQRNTQNAHWLLYMKLATHIIALGTVAATGAHFGYTDAVGPGYDIIVDTLCAVFIVCFWIYISPFLCHSVGERKAIATIQLLRIFVALGTVASKMHEYSGMVSITSGVFIALEPFFPLIVPILARVTRRDTIIVMFGGCAAFASLCACIMLMVYHSFGPLVGLTAQICVLFIALLSAASLTEEEIAFEFHTDHSENKHREHLSQTYLWCCVFPVGATTTLIGFDMMSLWGLGNAGPGWSSGKVDSIIAKQGIFLTLSIIISTAILHYVIPSKGESRLHSLIWWSSYYMATGFAIAFICSVVDNTLGLSSDHIVMCVLGGFLAGMFVSTPDIVLTVESSFGTDDFASLCVLFEILHNALSWLFSTTFRGCRLLRAPDKLAWNIACIGCMIILVAPYTFVILKLTYDPDYIYEKHKAKANENTKEPQASKW